MRRLMQMSAVLALAALASGCFEIKQDSTLNPDGSGKAVVELSMAAMPDFNMGDQKSAPPDPEVALKQFAKETIDSSEGVETWSDVAISRLDDGRMKFKGTAYFKDFAKMHVGKGDSGGVTWAKDPKGGMILTMDPNDKKDAAAPAPAKPPVLTDEELAARVKAEQSEYMSMRPMMEMMLAKMKMEMIFRLPGTLGEVSGFQKQPDGSLKFAIDGAKMLAVSDAMMKDEAYVKAAIKAGKKPGEDKNDPAMMEKLFGVKGPLTARVTGDLKPAFDYAAEVKAAKDAYPKMIEKLGLDKLPAKTDSVTITPALPGTGGAGNPSEGPSTPPAKAEPAAPAKAPAAKSEGTSAAPPIK